MQVKDVMVRDVATLDMDDELSLANDIMKLGRIRHLPVVSGKRLVGILSERDLFRTSLVEALGHEPTKTREVMKAIRIQDIMVKNLITLAPEADIREAVRLMLDHKIGCVPVVAGGELLGLITETDILRLYLEQLATAGQKG
ncbi:MAG: CBS domain-containing protein [Desulfobacca sp.]|uniref:CBS domain-containing protein n=1 Tax=Desulfobacca sp. TaxID=2067990 RepID=UPI00404AE7C6